MQSTSDAFCVWPAMPLAMQVMNVFADFSSDLHRLRPSGSRARKLKREKGIWWMPWRQEAMKDVARCEKPRGAASKL
tara:strand:- start:276 stop:506 length:231 start_codon:yes stop_codon:yes gene_type:complete